MSAQQDVEKILEPNEVVEAIVFGKYGWDGYSEPENPPVPENKQGVVLTWAEAVPFMQSWTFNGGYGAPQCYAVNIWTNKRVLWVTQYDGSTSLSDAARNPQPGLPDMPGG